MSLRRIVDVISAAMCKNFHTKIVLGIELFMTISIYSPTKISGFLLLSFLDRIKLLCIFLVVGKLLIG